MAEVNLNIDGRNYAVACDDGQEPRLQQLGSYVNERMREASISGSANKAQSMVLASLVLADEVFDLSERLAQSTQINQEMVSEAEKNLQGAGGKSASGATHVIEYQGMAPIEEQNVINLIGQMAAKVEKLTARVQKRSA